MDRYRGGGLIMPTLNSSYISDAQTRSLDEKVQDTRNTVDLDYQGFDRMTEESFEKYGMQSHVNRALLWLESKPNDYVRESFKGGVLYGLLAQNSNEPNLREWETLIRDRFNEEFMGDLSLVYVRLSMDKQRRILHINMMVKDNIARLTSTITTQAEY